MKTQQNLVVPWDFTKVSHYALEHAIRFSQIENQPIELLHIFDSTQESGSIEKRTEKLNLEKTKLEKKYGIKLSTKVIEGNIYNEISAYASATNARYVIMGTHGVSGFQKLFGSRAYKVLLGSPVPFYIVKSFPSTLVPFTNIVLPIDFKLDNIDKIDHAIYVGKHYGCKIHIFIAPINNRILKKQIHTNLNLAIQLLTRSNISFEIHESLQSTWFAKETIRFAKEIKADFVMVMATKYNFKDFIIGEHEQNVIDNSSNIPILVVNPSFEDDVH